MNLLCIFIGGGLGAILRYAATLVATRWVGSALPGTFAVNSVGCLMLGAVFGLVQSRTGCLSEGVRLLITSGFLGALTTFSTLNMEIFSLLRAGRVWCAGSYFLLSCFVGLVATAAGYYAAQCR